jgi:hypothetical protein
LKSGLRKLKEYRDENRPRPHLDDKVGRIYISLRPVSHPTMRC